MQIIDSVWLKEIVYTIVSDIKKATTMNADDAWNMFCQEETLSNQMNGWLAPEKELVRCGRETESQDVTDSELPAPECSPIYISTKTKIGYLNQSVPLEDMFWAIPVLPSYAVPDIGIVKKEMKFKTTTKSALDKLLSKVDAIEKGPLVQQSVKTHLDEDGSIAFKDIRKVSVGICKKQMTSFRSKVKGAFFNCFAIILRLKWEGEFREMHIKVFNTGKLEIPGIPGVNTNEFLKAVLDCLVLCLKPVSQSLGLEVPIDYRHEYNETVLTNSNFSANYLVDREKLTQVLRQHYRILTTYDPCSYPGVQSKFYYVESRAVQDGRPLTESEANEPHIVVPVMVFRTGSVLIVGKFDDDVLMWVYDFMKDVLRNQYAVIQSGLSMEEPTTAEVQTRKTKKRFIKVLVKCG